MFVNMVSIKFTQMVAVVIVLSIVSIYSQSSNNCNDKQAGGIKINAYRLPVDIEMQLQGAVNKELAVGDTISINLKFKKQNISDKGMLSDTLSNVSIDYDENILLQLDNDVGAPHKKLKANLKRGNFPNRTLRFKVINCGYTKVAVAITDLVSLDANLVSLPVNLKCKRLLKNSTETTGVDSVLDVHIPQNLVGF
jgi:hypothetical protein